MKKQFISVVSMTVCLFLFMSLFAGCHAETAAPQTYTISFYDDAELVGTIKTAGKESIDLPAAPQKEGCTFSGWFLDKDTWQNELTKDTFVDRALTGDVNAYAYYVQNEAPLPPAPAVFTITFYIGEEASASVQTAGNETLTLPVAPEKDTYTFEGWFFDNGTWNNKLTENTYANKPLTEDVNVYAYYRQTDDPEPEPPQTYTVTFDAGSGTPVEPVKTSRIEEEPRTTRDGYTFMGWYKESTFDNKVTFPYEVTQAQVLYAKWEKNTYRVRFEPNGGTAVADVTVSEIRTEPVTVRHGYTFDGWYKDAAFRNKVSFPYEVTAAQTLYAKWTANAPEDIVFTVDESGVLTGVSGLSEKDMRVEIPSQVNGITVTEIDRAVFKNNKNIGTLIFPDSVKYLRNEVCYGCTNLKEVQLPAGLTVIPDYAFEACSSLTSINFPVTLKEIRMKAFSGTALTEFVAPEALQSIWSYAFEGCNALSEVELKNVRSLGDGAFRYCPELQSVTLPDTLTALGGDMFGGCTSLTEIDMPDNPITVPSTMFDGTAFYNDPANWDNGVLYADGYLITGNSELAALTEYTVKEGTIVIADSAFNYPDAGRQLEKIVLPDGLYRIGKSAFSGLYRLTEINIPASVRAVGYAAFASTGYDTSDKFTDNGLYIDNWLVKVANVTMTSFTVREGTVGVADGKDTALFPTQAQKITRLSLPASLKYIGARSFARLRITDLQLPAGLITMGDGAFQSCAYLKTANLGKCTSLESIGELAFTSASLSEITIPASVVSMGELVFNQNAIDLTIRCEVSEKPEGWDKNWSFSYTQDVTITVVWNEA